MKGMKEYINEKFNWLVNEAIADSEIKIEMALGVEQLENGFKNGFWAGGSGFFMEVIEDREGYSFDIRIEPLWRIENINIEGYVEENELGETDAFFSKCLEFFKLLKKK